MPLGEGDVLNTLGDPIALGMNFRVGPVPISGKSYGIIRDHVRAGNILVVSGTSTLATYNGWTDILTTQKGNPPADIFRPRAAAARVHACAGRRVHRRPQGDAPYRRAGELHCAACIHNAFEPDMGARHRHRSVGGLLQQRRRPHQKLPPRDDRRQRQEHPHR